MNITVFSNVMLCSFRGESTLKIGAEGFCNMLVIYLPNIMESLPT